MSYTASVCHSWPLVSWLTRQIFPIKTLEQNPNDDVFVAGVSAGVADQLPGEVQQPGGAAGHLRAGPLLAGGRQQGQQVTQGRGPSPHICPAKLYFDLIDIIYLIGIHVTIIFRHFLACSQHKLIRNSNLKRELFNKFDISTETVNFFKSLPVHFLAWKKIFWLSNLLYPSVNQIN